jgi:hypothetical protein
MVIHNTVVTSPLMRWLRHVALIDTMPRAGLRPV